MLKYDTFFDTHTYGNSILLGCDTALQNNQFPTFPRNVGPSSVYNPKGLKI